MNTPPDWDLAREEMLLDPSVINLNTGSFGPLPRCVFERATKLRGRLAEQPMAFLVREAPPLLWSAREALATFLGADPARLLFTANVTASMNLVASSLRLASPGEILLSDHEYGTMHWCWQRAAARQGLSLRAFALPVLADSPEEIVDAVCKAFTDRTRLLFFSHVYSPTGLVMPAVEICREARRRGILTVIDGAHAAAMLPLDLGAVDADFYGGNCHKWLLAPTGSGFLHIGRGNETRLHPLQVSWGWHYDRCDAEERNPFGATHRLYQLEFEGTRDPCPWLTVPTALAFQQRLGWQNIREHNASLVAHVRRCLRDDLGLTLWTPQHPDLHGFLTTFRLPREHDAETLRAQLWDERIEAPIIERPDGLLVRVSTHFYNTAAEVYRLREVLKKILRRA